jgi:CheY-like chemotaxis protein
MTTARVLNAIVVDDDAASAAAVAKLLTVGGRQVTVCTDAQQAVLISLSGDVDLVSLDLTMPQLDGFEVMSLIRSHEHSRRTPSVPIIAITGRAAAADRAASLAAGFAAHLNKPVLLHDLEQMLQRVETLRSDLYRTRYTVDSGAISEQLDRMLDGAATKRFEAAVGLALVVEQRGRELLEQGLRRAYAADSEAAAQPLQRLIAMAELIGAAHLGELGRTVLAAVPLGVVAFEHAAVLTRAELDRVIYTLRERMLP